MNEAERTHKNARDVGGVQPEVALLLAADAHHAPAVLHRLFREVALQQQQQQQQQQQHTTVQTRENMHARTHAHPGNTQMHTYTSFILTPQQPPKQTKK